ncbi:hypothetical protein AVEN_35597-1 [Araneus ventricosus]|uniref:Uncharacterized protein n=1 Tax=Araneus ventricosus TaxID=182803 RepID=A0A4Y2CL07_ARAVE|nr:hypothetical protein AVEN_35597-1 [Araneus ventricosus]
MRTIFLLQNQSVAQGLVRAHHCRPPQAGPGHTCSLNNGVVFSKCYLRQEDDVFDCAYHSYQFVFVQSTPFRTLNCTETSSVFQFLTVLKQSVDLEYNMEYLTSCNLKNFLPGDFQENLPI